MSKQATLIPNYAATYKNELNGEDEKMEGPNCRSLNCQAK